VAAGGAGYGPPGADNMNQMLRDRFAHMNVAKAQIEKQREMDDAVARLQAEFEVMDLNRDGKVTVDEMTQYLQFKVNERAKIENIHPSKIDFNPGVVEDIFSMIDSNNDGRVTLDEFTKKYVEIRSRLRERLTETYKRIVDHKRQRDEMF
jgi:Ca2+-binding EF-hand superfamily protein